MRVLSVHVVALVTLVSATLTTTASQNNGIAEIDLDAERLTRELSAAHKQVKRSLRQYDFSKLVEPSSDEERTAADKVDDLLGKVDDLVGKVKVPANLNAAVEKAAMTADEIAAVARNVKKYPKGLSEATMMQIRKVEELRLKDLATYTKKTGDGMRRKIEPFEGIKIAPKQYLESHVGRESQLFGIDGSRLMSSAVVSRPEELGGGSVLLISSSNPKKNDWLLPKGGWDKGEGIQNAALREVVEEGGVNAKLLHDMGQFKVKDGDKAYTYYAYMMQAGKVYDDWAESVRYRLWVSYEDALKLLKNRPQMVDMVKKAQKTDKLITKGELEKADPKLANFALST